MRQHHLGVDAEIDQAGDLVDIGGGGTLDDC
jgi:hypothetical protein